MSEATIEGDVQIKLTISRSLASQIDKAMNGLYKYRQEYILEAVREKVRHDLEGKDDPSNGLSHDQEAV
jgi:metal-responsive CopG/Arc/MetJ family transcriptional regulator